MKIKFLRVLLPLVVILIGCSFSEQNKAVFPGISNRGIMPLSVGNAFVGSNLFIAAEMEKSPALLNFIRSRGAPQAIKVNERLNRAPELILYYLREGSLYVSELITSRTAYNWIVRGPLRMPSYESRVFTPQNFEMTGEPLLAVFDKLVRYDSHPPIGITRPVATVKLPPIKPKLEKHSVTKKSTGAKAKVHTAKEAPTPYKPLNTDQMAIQMSQGFAERDNNGDVIHTVKRGSESLASIASWYTGDKKKAGAIATASGIEESDTLNVGTRIRIPLDLVKNGKQLP